MNSYYTAQGGSNRDLPASPDPVVDPDHPTVPDPDDDPLMNEEQGGDGGGSENTDQGSQKVPGER
ncbi:hypothetical protein ACIQUF_01225 [Pseudomonas sp. NPDC090233]|uniref:hypothetical protein n=1 Tax=Pseudomonas sp. NPDC090233 TaxID=3364479 RepID=UPI00383B07A1